MIYWIYWHCYHLIIFFTLASELSFLLLLWLQWEMKFFFRMVSRQDTHLPCATSLPWLVQGAGNTWNEADLCEKIVINRLCHEIGRRQIWLFVELTRGSRDRIQRLLYVHVVAKYAAIFWRQLCSKLFFLSILPGGFPERASVTRSVRFSTFNSSISMVPGKYCGREKKNKTWTKTKR